jgi:hypothetical protein
VGGEVIFLHAALLYKLDRTKPARTNALTTNGQQHPGGRYRTEPDVMLDRHAWIAGVSSWTQSPTAPWARAFIQSLRGCQASVGCSTTARPAEGGGGAGAGGAGGAGGVGVGAGGTGGGVGGGVGGGDGAPAPQTSRTFRSG